ncbi:hypothetical protein MKY34_04640 [Sporosarcina sp. FSL K6-1522]|uniref:hypothetical protein n=1 Tax=Sporosarcina sp. FSL K6-1522 TaxID=2921554 RepID=UPI00315A6C02
MDWFLLLFLGFILSLFVLIGLLLISLAKQGDERGEFIKTKAMTSTFLAIVGLLIWLNIKALYVIFAKGEKPEGINPFTFLVVISIVFLVNLLYNKKKLT